MKMMLKGGLGLAVVIAVAYAALPAAREWITAISPSLFFLICPLMMFFMMKGMQSCHVENGIKKNDPTQIPISKAANSGDNPESIGHKKAL